MGITRRSALSIIILILIASVFGVVGITKITDAVNANANEHAVCPSPDKDYVRCLAHVKVDKDGKPGAASTPKGYGPTQFRSAYSLPSTSGNPATIAIVDAYDHAKIKSDLDVYNKTFGLPYFPSCSDTVTTGCFMKVDQRGGTNYPKADSGWAMEIALDVEVAHGICPSCKLILVEADSASFGNMMAAVDTAVAMGATVVSNSYGANEYSGETAYDVHFNVPGVAFVFSSGDYGYGTTYPASSPYVTAVGGTTLRLTSAGTRLSESVWSGAGSGCSIYESKPAFQQDSGCASRTVADVSAVADPNTGAAVYDSIKYQGKSGWMQIGGTSLSAPIIAGIYGLAGNVTAAMPANAMPYNASADSLFDVTSGSNGVCSPDQYLCTGVTGYDGPTGLGSPNGIGAF